MNKRERIITVCDRCFSASCWHGKLMCWDSNKAGTVEKTESELAALNAEHPSNYSQEAVEKVCGGIKWSRP